MKKINNINKKLLKSVIYRKYDDVSKLMIDGADAFCVDNNGYCSVRYAVDYFDVELLDILISNVDVLDKVIFEDMNILDYTLYLVREDDNTYGEFDNIPDRYIMLDYVLKCISDKNKVVVAIDKLINSENKVDANLLDILVKNGIDMLNVKDGADNNITRSIINNSEEGLKKLIKLYPDGVDQIDDLSMRLRCSDGVFDKYSVLEHSISLNTNISIPNCIVPLYDDNSLYVKDVLYKCVKDGDLVKFTNIVNNSKCIYEFNIDGKNLLGYLMTKTFKETDKKVYFEMLNVLVCVLDDKYIVSSCSPAMLRRIIKGANTSVLYKLLNTYGYCNNDGRLELTFVDDIPNIVISDTVINNALDGGINLLMYAIIKEDINLINTLLVSNIDLHHKDYYGRDVMYYVGLTKNAEIVNLFRGHRGSIIVK